MLEPYRGSCRNKIQFSELVEAEQAAVPTLNVAVGTVLSMPAHDRIRLNDMQHVSPPRPESRCKQPEEPIPFAQLRPGMALLELGDLLAQRQVLEREIPATLEY